MSLIWKFGNMQICSIVCLLLIYISLKSKAENVEKLLFEDLLRDYDKRIRPLENHTESLVVNVDAELVRILSVNDDYGEITAIIWFRLNWNDLYLQWDQEKYDNVSEVVIASASIWTPDLVLYNGIDEYTLKSKSNNAEVIVNSEGDVYWTVSAHVTASCVIVSSMFPFDKHQCELEWGSWAYSKKQLDLITDGQIDVQESAESPQWKIIDVKISRREVFYNCCPKNPYPRIIIYLNLQRRSLHYVLGLIFPCIIFSFLIVLQFLIPPNIGERVVFGILSMIFLAIYGYFVSGFSLKSWPTLPLIAIYIFCLLLGASAALTNTCLVVNFFHAKHNAIMQPWVKKLLLKILPDVMYMKNIPLLVERKMDWRQKSLKMKPLPPKSDLYKAVVEPLLPIAEREQDHGDTGTGTSPEPVPQSIRPMATAALLEILRDIRELSYTVNVRLAETKGSIEWMYAAEVVNRFGLITITVYFALCHVIIVIKALF